MTLTISVFSDVICPWCYLGKRRLEHALDQLGLRESTEVEWLPFELNPDMPLEGIERSIYRTRKFGTKRSAELDVRMTALGREEGISFDFDRMQRTPNSRRAHILMAAAQQQGCGDALAESLFRAYFEQGRDIGDLEVLIDLAGEASIAHMAAVAALQSDKLHDLITSVEAQAVKTQISGVPFFIIDQTWAIPGAQTAGQWVKTIQEKLKN